EAAECARASGGEEAERDRCPGVADRLAEDDEDARPDDRADAEGGQIEQADAACQLRGLALRVRGQLGDRLGGEQAPLDLRGRAHRPSPGGEMTSAGRRERLT